jgi:hypothetical protein
MSNGSVVMAFISQGMPGVGEGFHIAIAQVLAMKHRVLVLDAEQLLTRIHTKQIGSGKDLMRCTINLSSNLTMRIVCLPTHRTRIFTSARKSNAGMLSCINTTDRTPATK